ncbi:MAG: ferrous iron transporter B [Acidobacteria bacterium]|nr:ferrous iron transporter B [Acidobacteriota bacterium]
MPSTAAHCEPDVGQAAGADELRARQPRIALIGNPNTGKTTLFNRLCGVRAKTSNYPGTTTAVRVGRAAIGGDAADIVDLPGLYELSLDVPEARIVRDVLRGVGAQQPDAVLVVVDACNLTRNLVLAGELLGYGLPVIVALNMVDLAQRRGLSLDTARLSARLGCPVVPVVARRGTGIDAIQKEIARVLRGEGMKAAAVSPAATSADLTRWAEEVVEESVGGAGAVGSASDTLTERLDKAFTHPVLGLLVFGGVMIGLFWTLFALATVPMDLIEATFAELGDLAGRTFPPGLVHDLVAEGIIGGIAGTVVFLPQICLLFFLISLLEDTGYLARAAFVMDRVLCRFGLPGHAFVPLLTAHACALPGIMATRLIPDRRDRLATILVAPFMSCSARLPVYVLLTSLLFAGDPLRAGLAFAGCYALGAGAALLSALLFRRTVLRGRARPMILELPSYKAPSLLNALIAARDQGLAFLKTAGTAIMAICIVMWWLNTFPRTAPTADVEALRTQAAAAATADEAASLNAEADVLMARATQTGSFAGRIGRTIQPVFAPLGYDWQLTVGVLTSFLAREVFVSTMSVLLGDANDDVNDQGVIARIRSAERADGTPVFTAATATSLLVFFVLAMQCLPTLAVTRRETGDIKWAALQLGYMTVLAYGVAFVAYQGLRFAGVS